MAERIHIEIAYSPEQRENEWAFYIHDFGFRVYADTEAEGHQAVRAAINALLVALRHDRSRLTKYLDTLEVPYHIWGAPERHPLARHHIGSEVRTLNLDEVLGAPRF